MQTQQTTLARIIGAIGERDFAAATAEAVRGFMDFDLAAILVHRRQDHPTLMFDNFDAVGCRQGLQNYVAYTHILNPMVRRATGAGVFRARDFEIRPQQIADDARPYLMRAPEEELGFLTVGWPERLEEIGLYFHACGGVVELGFYRERGRRAAPARKLSDLEELGEPIAAAFNKHAVLSKTPRPALDVLSERERQIAELLLMGCSSEAIALRLEISRHTVKDHRKQIFRKLGIGSLAELFAHGAGVPH